MISIPAGGFQWPHCEPGLEAIIDQAFALSQTRTGSWSYCLVAVSGGLKIISIL